MNHLMVLVSRWIFMPRDAYGMSSRYALQYQIGILGIFLTFALVFQQQRAGRTSGDREEDGRIPREHGKGPRARNRAERPMAPWVRAAALMAAAVPWGKPHDHSRGAFLCKAQEAAQYKRCKACGLKL